MFQVILCGCSESRDLIESKMSDFLGASSKKYEILEFDTVDELIEKNVDFDVCFINEQRSSDMTKILDYMKQMGDEKYRAFGGIQNPIPESELEMVAKHLSYLLGAQSATLTLEFLTDRGIRNIPIGRIQYFEFVDRKVKIQSADDVYLINDSLKNIFELVGSHGFFQIHKSIIVNLEYVERVKNYVITMQNGEELPLSQKKSREFREALAGYANK